MISGIFIFDTFALKGKGYKIQRPSKWEKRFVILIFFSTFYRSPIWETFPLAFYLYRNFLITLRARWNDVSGSSNILRQTFAIKHFFHLDYWLLYLEFHGHKVGQAVRLRGATGGLNANLIATCNCRILCGFRFLWKMLWHAPSSSQPADQESFIFRKMSNFGSKKLKQTALGF